MSKTYIFYINGMRCVSCSGAIEKHLRKQLGDKLQNFHVDFTTADPKKTIIVLADDGREYDEVWSELKGYIHAKGYTCEVDKGKSFFTSHWFLGALGCISGLTVLMVCMMTGGLSLPFMIPLAGFSVLLTLGLGAKSYYEAWSKLIKSGTLTMDSLFALSTLSIIGVSLASLFLPWLPMMFDAGLLIYGFRHIGIAIEDTIKEKISATQFQDRVRQFPDLKPGDVIEVKAGETIPIDGICENESLIYNTLITGSTLPRSFKPQEHVLAGMRVADHAPPLILRVTKIQKESYLARLDKVLGQSILEKAPIEIKTSQLLTYFIPAVIVFAISSGIFIGLFFPAATAIQCALTVLVSACPCTLGLITPLAVKTGMHKAAENGIQFKNSKILQQAEQVDTVIFDLNGTLTTGVPEVKSYHLSDGEGLTEIEFFALCSALEKESNHPIGKAIYEFMSQNRYFKFMEHEFKVSEVNKSHHSGVIARINNKNYAIGSLTLMQGKDFSKISPSFLAAGEHAVYVARENRVIACIILTDPLRLDASRTTKALMEMGKELVLCTGSDAKTAQYYANALGIRTVYADCVASSTEIGERSKTACIDLLKKKGHVVAMIGDAGNDAPAIAASDLGIAVASEGSDEVTQQTAGILIHSGALFPIVSAFTVSRQTVSNIKQNLIMSLAYNIGSILVSGGLLVALGVTINPGIGVAIMILQACIILLNVYRFKQQALVDPTQEEDCVLSSSYSKMKSFILESKPESDCEPSVQASINQNKSVSRASKEPKTEHSFSITASTEINFMGSSP